MKIAKNKPTEIHDHHSSFPAQIEKEKYMYYRLQSYKTVALYHKCNKSNDVLGLVVINIVNDETTSSAFGINDWNKAKGMFDDIAIKLGA